MQKRRRCEAAEADNLCAIRSKLRQVQYHSGCATSTLDLVLKCLHPFLKGCEHLTSKQMHMASEVKRLSPLKRQLHGCAECNNHVFGPQCTATHCPKCAAPRYCPNGNPYEVVFLFVCCVFPSLFFALTVFLFLTCLFVCLLCRYVGIFRWRSKWNVYLQYLTLTNYACTKKNTAA